MAISRSYFPSHRLIVSVFTGNITDEELVRHVKILNEDLQLRQGHLELADVTGIRSIRRLTTYGFQTAASRERDQERVRSGRLAIVAKEDWSFGLGRMFQTYAEQSPRPVSVFRSLDDAIAWLEVEDIRDEIRTRIAECCETAEEEGR